MVSAVAGFVACFFVYKLAWAKALRSVSPVVGGHSCLCSVLTVAVIVLLFLWFFILVAKGFLHSLCSLEASPQWSEGCVWTPGAVRRLLRSVDGSLCM